MAGSISNLLRSRSIFESSEFGPTVASCQHLALQSSSPREQKAQSSHAKLLLKKNRSDEHIRTLPAPQPQSLQRPSHQASSNACQTSVKKKEPSAAQIDSMIEPVTTTNFAQYTTNCAARTERPSFVKQKSGSFVEQQPQQPSATSPKGASIGGSPIEILKRFKMQKKTQQAQKANLTTVEDETLNELDLPADEECHAEADNTFRQTVFNPKHANPNKLLSPKTQAVQLQMQRQISARNHRPTERGTLETQPAQPLTEQVSLLDQQREKAFNKTFDGSKKTVLPVECAAALLKQEPRKPVPALQIKVTAVEHKRVAPNTTTHQKAAKTLMRTNSASNSLQALLLQ